MLIRRLSLAALLLLLAAVNYQLWMGAGGLLETRKLQRELSAQQVRNERLRERNEAARDWLAQSQRPEAIEAHARSELGMVRHGETLFWVIDGKGSAASQQERPAPTDGTD